MKDMKQLELEELKWQQADTWGKNYELVSPDGEIVARLVRPSWWKEYTEVDAPGMRWSFERKGLFRQRIVIKAVATGDEPARFDCSLSGGTLTFADGRVYHWKSGNFWGSKWVWTTPDDQPVIGFRSGGILRFTGELELSQVAAQTDSLALMLFLGWYLVTLSHQDSTVIIAATAGAGS